MNILFDTDVLIDFLLDREPFSEPAAQLLSIAERGDIHGYVCGTSVTTIFYLARKVVGRSKARRQVEAILSILEVAPVGRAILVGALHSQVSDFEDAVVAYAASQASVDIVVTRNQKDFKKSPVLAQTPVELLALLNS